MVELTMPDLAAAMRAAVSGRSMGGSRWRAVGQYPLNTLEEASHVERFWNQQAAIAHPRTKMID